MASIPVQFALDPGVQLPLDVRTVGTTAERAEGTSLYTGLLRYNTTLGSFEFYDSESVPPAWQQSGGGLSKNNLTDAMQGRLATLTNYVSDTEIHKLAAIVSNNGAGHTHTHTDGTTTTYHNSKVDKDSNGNVTVTGSLEVDGAVDIDALTDASSGTVWARFSHKDAANATDFAIAQNADGQVLINSAGSQSVSIGNATATGMRVDSSEVNVYRDIKLHPTSGSSTMTLARNGDISAVNVTASGELRINGSTLVEANWANVQADWNEADTSSHAYIKDKPTLLTSLPVDANGDPDGVVIASKLVAVDANKDVTGFHDVTLSGELRATTLRATVKVFTNHLRIDGALIMNDTTVTATAAELNILDGVTATATELNTVADVVAGTVSAGKAVVTDSNLDVTGFRNLTAENLNVIPPAGTFGGSTVVTSSSITPSGTISALNVVQSQHYHLVIRLNTNTGNSSDTYWQCNENTWTTLNTLQVVTAESPTTTYDSDLTNQTTWSPSVSGVFQITASLLFRSKNQDALTESGVQLMKDGGTVLYSSDKRWGSSDAESNARVMTNHNTIATSIYATTDDTFSFRVYGRSSVSGANNIWVLTGASFAACRITITKVA